MKLSKKLLKNFSVIAVVSILLTAVFFSTAQLLVCFAKEIFWVDTHNVVVRHMRFRGGESSKLLIPMIFWW